MQFILRTGDVSGKEVKYFFFLGEENPVEKECWGQGPGLGLGGEQRGGQGRSGDTSIIKPEPQGKMEEVVSRVPHVGGHWQAHLRSSEIKYLIWSFSSQHDISLCGRWESFLHSIILQPSVGHALEMKAWIVVCAGRAGERSSGYQSEGEVISSNLGNVGTFWLPYVVEEESEERGRVVPTWWYKEEELRKLRAWGHLDSTLKPVTAYIGLPDCGSDWGDWAKFSFGTPVVVCIRGPLQMPFISSVDSKAASEGWISVCKE